jgi:hypothetical protein
MRYASAPLPLALAALLTLAACGNANSSAPTPNVAPLLDGRAELQPEPLADLAYKRALLGGRWLAGAIRKDGSFYYEYAPQSDSYEKDEYNEVRHAGATYSLWQLYGATRSAQGGDEAIREAAEAASGWIEANSVDLGARGRAFVWGGRMKLGGQALALVALLERRRVTGDTAYDKLIDGLARFMLAMELPQDRGRYFQSFDARRNELLLTPDSDFYPGEALLALTRLAQQDFNDGPWLEAARRAAQYLVYRKDGDIPAAGKVPRHDHWLTMALAELHRLHRDDSYRKVVYLQADDLIERQFGADAEHPQRIGAAQPRKMISYTSTATKGEALAAAWALARAIGDEAAADRFALGARRNGQFRMRVQWLPDNTGLYPNPQRLYGGWGASPAKPTVRIDFVQHNVSALIGLWSITRNGDLALAGAKGGSGDPPAARPVAGGGTARTGS